jgi:hypothetical protein
MKPMLHVAAVGGGMAIAAAIFLLFARQPLKLPFEVVIDNTGAQRKRPPISKGKGSLPASDGACTLLFQELKQHKLA